MELNSILSQGIRKLKVKKPGNSIPLYGIFALFPNRTGFFPTSILGYRYEILGHFLSQDCVRCVDKDMLG